MKPIRTTTAFVLLCLLGTGASAQNLEAGQLLYSSPIIDDGSFAETVLLLVYHEEDRSLAIALNRPTWLDAGETFADVDQVADYSGTLFYGGPVGADQLLILFEDEQRNIENARRVMNGIHVSPDLGLLENIDLTAETGPRVLLFAGHAEWTPGQLAAEVAAGGWRVVPATPELIFSANPERLWRSLPSNSDLTAAR